VSQVASQVQSAIAQTTSQLGQPIVYTPADDEMLPFSCLAVIEEVDSIQMSTGSPLAITAERRNFLVQVSDYEPTPSRGDQIEYAGDIYTVMIPSDKKAVWEWSDKFNFRRRIFTHRTQ
jgi:hypothetical protein